MFWIGENKDKLLDMTSSIDKKYELEIGPSKIEHNLLYEKSKYYRESYDMKIWSFCSDVWRFYKLSRSVGLYLDASTIIGDNFDNFISKIDSFDVALFKGTDTHIETGVMWSGEESNSLFLELFDFYCRDDISPRWTHFAPQILTWFVYRKYSFPINFDIFQVNNEIKLFNLTDIRNKDEVWKTSVHSWGSKKIGSNYFELAQKNDKWIQHVKNYENSVSNINFRNQFNTLLKHGVTTANVSYIRRYYDIEPSREKLREMKRVYKALPYTPPFSKKLIWSKLFRLFTFRIAN